MTDGGGHSHIGTIRKRTMAGESKVNLEPTHSSLARPPTSTRTLIGEAAGDGLGFSIPLSDDGIRLAIGAIFKDRKGENAGVMSGFRLDGMSFEAQVVVANFYVE